QKTFRVVPQDRCTQLAGPAFDAVVFEMWPCLTAGASLYLADDETRGIPPKLVRWLAENAISIAYLPTPLAEATLEEDWPEHVCLRVMHTAGDKLHRAPRKNLPFTLCNLYGPTENSVATTWVEV